MLRLRDGAYFKLPITRAGVVMAAGYPRKLFPIPLIDGHMSERWDISRFSLECLRFQRRVMGVCAVSILAVVACFGLVLPLRDQIKIAVTEHFGSSTAEVVIGMTPFPAVLVLFIGLFWLQRQSNKVQELNCPQCKKFLGGQRYLVVATKCCPHCGVQVLQNLQ